MSKEDASFKTLRHIEAVRNYINLCIKELLHRAEQHDQSKLEAPEVEPLNALTERLRGSTYNSPEYLEFRRELKPILDHHYAHNRHHPEWENSNLLKWKDIQNYEGLYQISNYGDVKSLDRVSHREITGNLKIKGKYLKSTVTPKDYLRIQLSKDGISKNHLVHVLVAKAFIPNPNNKPQVNHINCDKKNNNVNNLEWCDNSKNQIHAYETGLQKIKYIVHCEELNITTFGCGEMQRKLKELGYEKASNTVIRACVNEESSHHLNLHFNGWKIEEFSRSNLSNMTLIDLIEMIMDWKASSMRHNDGNILKSIAVNQERFEYSDELRRIFENTAKWLDSQNVYHKANES